MENVNVEKRLQVFGCKERKLIVKKPWFLTLAILLILPMVSASGENISFSYPSSANYGEEWSASVELISFSENVYDVKIDVWNSTTRISEMNNNGNWKSTNYYFIGAINTSVENLGSFDLNITKIYDGGATINVTLRKNGGSTLYKFGPYPLTVSYEIPEVPEEPVEEKIVENESVGEEVNESSEVIVNIKENSTSDEVETVKETVAAPRPIDYDSETPPLFSISGDAVEDERVVGEEIVNPRDERIQTISIYLFTATLIVAALYLAKLRFWS